MTVGLTYWPWEPTATLRSALCRRGLLGGARRFSAHRGRRGAGAYCGGRPPTACLSWVAALADGDQCAAGKRIDQLNQNVGLPYLPVESAVGALEIDLLDFTGDAVQLGVAGQSASVLGSERHLSTSEQLTAQCQVSGSFLQLSVPRLQQYITSLRMQSDVILDFVLNAANADYLCVALSWSVS